MRNKKIKQGGLVEIINVNPDKPDETGTHIGVVVAVYDQYFVVKLKADDTEYRLLYHQILRDGGLISDDLIGLHCRILTLNRRPVISGKGTNGYTYLPK